MPPKAKPAAKAKKPAAKAAPKAKPAAKAAPKTKTAAKTSHNAKAVTKPATMRHQAPNAGPPRREGPPTQSVFALVFTKCKGVHLLLVEESFEKWGAPGGSLQANETPETGLRREFAEETGYELPPAKMEETLTHGNAIIKLIFTEDCLGPGFGMKARRTGDTAIKALRHVEYNRVYDTIRNPTPGFPIRPVFTSMLIEHEKEIQQFINKIK